MSYFNIVAQTNENTVVTEYESVTKRSDAYQSEAELEKEFIRLLTEQGYEYLHIHTEAELIANLRKKLEEVNGYTFTDSEWKRLRRSCEVMSLSQKKPEKAAPPFNALSV